MADTSNKVEQLFDEAIQILDRRQREEFLKIQCGDNPDLRNRVDRLLKAHENSPTFMESPPILNGLGDSRGPTEPYQAGFTIDRFKLLSLIGEGGMGEVWQAEQIEPVRRVVAIKLIKPGMDSRQVMARFESERQALARMEHPYVAKVFDGGITDRGRPYFVMELVNGIAINDFCSQNKLDLDARLKLFILLCQAVQHAHQRGILHRDLKPSNVLVHMQDGVPTPKVIDFGLAKAIEGKLIDQSQLTMQGLMVGTPQYMSPEQASRDDSHVDTRSDLYSLGVVLYELLTGRTPLLPSEAAELPYIEILAKIREHETPKPSARISSSENRVAAEKQGFDIAKMQRALSRELDWIVLKALEKNPERRYDSVGSMARDLQRFLDGEPIEARPPTKIYLLQKFLRRNRLLVQSAALSILLLLGSLATTLWQAYEAKTQRNIAQTQAQRADDNAKAERLRSEQLAKVAEFQSSILKQFSPQYYGMMLRKDLVERFTTAIAKRDLGAAETQAEVEKFQSQLNMLDSTDVAYQFLETSLLIPAEKILDDRYKEQPTVDANLRQRLAVLYRLFEKYDRAIELQRTVIELLINSVGQEHIETLRAQVQLAQCYQLHQKPRDAEPLYLEALKNSRSMEVTHPAELIQLMGDYANCLEDLSKLDESAALLRQAIEIEKSSTAKSWAPGRLQSALGRVLSTQGNFDEAIPLLKEAYELEKETLGEENTSTIASLRAIGLLYVKQENFKMAEPIFEEVLKLSRRFYGEQHPATIYGICNSVNVLRTLGKLEEAEALCAEGIEKGTRTLGKNNSLTLFVKPTLASVRLSQGRIEEAEWMAREVLSGTIKGRSETHPSAGEARKTLAEILVQQKKFEEAESELLKAEQIFAQSGPSSSEALKKCHQELVKLYQLWGKAEEANKWINR